MSDQAKERKEPKSRLDEGDRKEKDRIQELKQPRTMLMIDQLAKHVKEVCKLDEGENKKTAQNQELPEESPIFRRDTSCIRKRTYREVVKTVNVPTLRRVDLFISEYGDDDGMSSHDENWWRERLLKKPIDYSNDIEKSINKKEDIRIRNGIVIKERILTNSMESSDESDDERFYTAEAKIQEGEGTSTSGVFTRQRSLEKSLESKKDGEFGKLKISKRTNKEKENADDGMKKQRKRKVVYDEGPYPPPKLSMEVKKLIAEKAKEKGGSLDNEGEILVIQKSLTESDIKRQQNRFSIPVNKMENKFLNNEEEAYIDNKDKQCNYMTVDIIEPSGKVKEVNLTLWNVGKTSKLYILNGDWKQIVPHNQLHQGDIVQLWAVRIDGRLCFVFVIL